MAGSLPFSSYQSTSPFAKMGLNSRANVGPDTQSLGVASMPRTNQKPKQTKQPQKQTKSKKQTNNNSKPRKRQNGNGI